MKRILPVLLYLLSVLISNRYCNGYWVVGPVFATAYLFAHFENVKRNFSLRHILFIAVSTLVYALVYGFFQHAWTFKQDFLDMLFGGLTAGVILGSCLMPIFHKLIFSEDSKRVKKVILRMILSWYLVNLFSLLDNLLGIPGQINYLLIAIALWQGIYFWYLKI